MWKRVINEFCDKYDCDPSRTTFENMETAIAKLQTGQLKFDVFFPTSTSSASSSTRSS